MKLTARTVLVTGASTGIGAATAQAAAQRGARVLLLARSADKLDEVAAGIRAGGAEAYAYPVDVSDHEAVTATAAQITEATGTPDVIVNNAGAGRFLFIEETSPEEFVQQAAVPFFATFFVTRAFIEPMIARGSGHIVNVNTPISRMVWPGSIGYAAARWGVRGLTEGLRADLAGTGIKVTEIIPGKVSSDYFNANPGAEARIPAIARIIPTITPEQCAQAIVTGIERDAREVNTPLMYRLLAAQTRYLPRLTEVLMRRTGARRGA